MDFYVYMMLRPDGRPCYVGKGKRNRYLDMNRGYNPHLHRIIKQAGGKLRSVKIRENLTEAQAMDFERLTIALLGREHNGGILVNVTDGGDGVSGWIASPDTRARMSAAGRGRPKSPAHRAKIGRPGRVMTPESRAKMKASAAARWARPEERAKVALFHASMADEQKAERARTIAAATQEAMARPEIRQRLSNAAKVAHVKRERTLEGRFL